MAQQESRRSLPERVAGLYYSHGLFCSSHPVAVIGVAIVTVLLCCYPLLNLPLPGNQPQRLWSSGNSTFSNQWDAGTGQDNQVPRWFAGPPTVYIQQIVLRSTVAPWTDELRLTDAFRAPLAQVFPLLEIIRNFQHDNSSKTLRNLCLHVEAVKVKSDKRPSVLPEYNCLILSPAGLWQQNQANFQQDPSLLTTIFGYQNLQKGKISLSEMLFGMNMKETGIKRYPLRTRQRVLQFAITVVLEDYDKEFVDSLHQKLQTLYPLHQLSPNKTEESQATNPQTLHIYYPGQFRYQEFLPLAITYFCLFLYVYFSVRKIELVKSKFGMAFSAMVTVLASLFMSIGLCFFFGLTLNLNGKAIFPYLVVIVGLENVLVLTKSVVSTPMHLDVKIRVAQGLSREGWSITKNLLLEVTILTIGLFTFVPAIQEFCIFAVVGLISDYFLQMVFFSTVLAIDIRRMEQTSDFVRIDPSLSGDNRTAARRFRQPYSQASSPRNFVRSKSHPKLNGMTSAYPTNVIASYDVAPGSDRLPKRLRLVHFWARTRIFQRMFMVSMVVWISVIVYSSFPVERLFPGVQDSELRNVGKVDGISDMLGGLVAHVKVPEEYRDKYGKREDGSRTVLNEATSKSMGDEEGKVTATSASILQSKMEPLTVTMDDLNRVRHTGSDPWQRLSSYHWPTILSMYNMSLSGRYVSILPAVRLSLVVGPEAAVAGRNLDEKQMQFQWQALAAALDPLDISEDADGKSSPALSEAPYVPSSPMELFLMALLCVVSVLVVAYTLVKLYGCVCTRNYAEWRSSWRDKEAVGEGASQVVMEGVPLVLEGHPQDIECLTTDGALLVSSDLSGQLRVWDSLSGESLAVIDRKTYFASSQRRSVTELEQEDLPLSDYESGSPPSSSETSHPSTQKTSLGSTHYTTSTLLHGPDHQYTDSRENRTLLLQTSTESNKFSLLKEYNLLPRHKSLSYNSALRNLPDLSPMIKTNFTSWDKTNASVERVASAGSDADLASDGRVICLRGTEEKRGYDYGDRYRQVYDEHCKQSASDCEDEGCALGRQCQPNRLSQVNDILDVQKQRVPDESSYNFLPQPSFTNSASSDFNNRHSKISSNSLSNLSSDFNFSDSFNSSCGEDFSTKEVSNPDLSLLTDCRISASVQARETSGQSVAWGSSPTDVKPVAGIAGGTTPPAIWCLDCDENLVAIGCSNGRLEFWEGSTGTFKCLFEDLNRIGVTAVKLIGNRVVAAKLSGSLDFYELESYSHGRPIDWGFTSHRRTHVRSGSAGSALDWDSLVSRQGPTEDIRCIRLNTTRAHQQPITVLESEGGRVLTGSQDHTLKVYRLEDQLPVYTLHGHCGPITCLFIDRISPMMSGSGSQDGLLCVWDLLTGACMYSIQAHSGSVGALTYSASYVISLGTDERLCVWERFQGHLLNTIQLSQAYCTSMVMLTHNLLVTSKQGSLVVWDVRTGDPVRMVTLGHSDACVFVKQVLLLSDSIACDYGNQLRVVRFPLVTDKCD